MLPSTDLLGTPSELWVMFNSRTVTAVDPHGNWIFFLLCETRAGEERDTGRSGSAL